MEVELTEQGVREGDKGPDPEQSWEGPAFDRSKDVIDYNGRKESEEGCICGYFFFSFGGSNARGSFCLMIVFFFFPLWNVRLRVREKEAEPEAWWESTHCKEWIHKLIRETERLLGSVFTCRWSQCNELQHLEVVYYVLHLASWKLKYMYFNSWW